LIFEAAPGAASLPWSDELPSAQLTSYGFRVKAALNGDRSVMCAIHALAIASMPDAAGNGRAPLFFSKKTTAKTTIKTV